MILRTLAVAVVLGTVACRSAQTFPCEGVISPRAPRNFGQVFTADGQPTQMYRGGQPTDCGQLEYLQSLGVRRILKLNQRNLPQDSGELTHAARLGFETFDLPFGSASIGRSRTCAKVREALKFMEAGEGPVYVHCTAGKDRTGYMIGLFERIVLHKPGAMVMAELRRFGHRGVRSLLMPQIDRELRKDMPECAVE